KHIPMHSKSIPYLSLIVRAKIIKHVVQKNTWTNNMIFILIPITESDHQYTLLNGSMLKTSESIVNALLNEKEAMFLINGIYLKVSSPLCSLNFRRYSLFTIRIE
ncbi:TPA: hypothetical protein ACIAER_004776, partial [Escherichia coli]